MRKKTSHPDIIDTEAPEFRKVSAKEAEAFAELLDSCYTKEALWGIVSTMADFILTNNIGVSDGTGSSMLPVRQAMEVKTWKSSVVKDKIVRMLSEWMGCTENLQVYFALQSVGMNRLYMKVASSGSVDLEQARELSGQKVVSLEKGRYYFHHIKVKYDDVPWLVSNGAYTEQGLRVELPAGMRRVFFNALFPPEPMEKVCFKELPEASSKGLHVFDGASETHSVIPVLQNYIKNDVIELGATKMNVTNAKKVARGVGLKEFFPDETRDLSVWRTTMLAGTMKQLAQSLLTDARTTKGILRELAGLEWLAIEPGRMFIRHLLPFYAWRTTTQTQPGVARELSVGVKEVFEKIPEGCWIGFNDFLKEFHRTPASGLLFNLFTVQDREGGIILNKNSDVWVSNANFKQQIGVPLVQSFMAYLAAIGCAEIAWDDAHAGDPSPLSRLRYVRLTEVGRYAFGLTDKLNVPQGENSTKEEFELSDTHLLLRPLSADNPYIGIVKEFAAAVGAGRYQVNEKTFLEGIRDDTDLKARISVFREIVCDTPPQVWEDFFKKLLDNAEAFETVEMEWVLMKVREDRTDLLRLVATDAELRRMVIRAERGYLIVPVNNLLSVKERLRALGYLI